MRLNTSKWNTHYGDILYTDTPVCSRLQTYFKHFILVLKYTAQNNYVCTRLFAIFDVLNWSLNTKVYIILKLVQFSMQL